MRRNQSISEPHQAVAAEVRAELARQRISQHELARRLGVAQATVSRRITGEVPFDVAELASISDALGVPVSQFLSAADRAGAV